MRFEHIHATRIKAHRSNLQATIQGDLQEWVGNAVVDELATEAAAMGAPSKETFTARELDVSNRVAFYRFVAKLLRLWVPTNPTPHRAKTPKALKIRVPHDLERLPFLYKWGCGKWFEDFQNPSNQRQEHMLGALTICRQISQSSPEPRAPAHGVQLPAVSRVVPLLQQVRLLLADSCDRPR